MTRNLTHCLGIRAIVLLAAAGLLGAATTSAHASTLVDSFEDFAGNSGDSVNGYVGDGSSGTWSGNNTAFANVMTGDATAYDGDNVLRLIGGNSGADGSGGGQVIAQKNLAQPYDVAQGPTTISWVARRLQLKDAPTKNDAGLIFEFFFTDGNTVSRRIELNDNLFSLEQDTWYEFTLDLEITNGNQMSINYHAVNADDPNDVFVNNANWVHNLPSSDFTKLDRIDFRTWSGNEYAHEVDAVTLVPEPASLALLGLGGLLMLGRSRRA